MASGSLAIAQDDNSEPELSAAEKAVITEEIVAKGRAYLGGSKKLDAIDSIRLQGVLVYGNGQSGTFESVFKRPNYHQFISVIAGSRETSTLDRTEAWSKFESLENPASYSLNFYEVEDMLNLQATVLDTLSFLKPPPTRKGSIEYLATGVIEDKEYVVLLYRHGDGIWFRRYFEPETGRVAHMVNNKGVVFTYEGRLEVDGVVFPQKTIVRFITQFGEQRMEISNSSIALNKDVDLQRFRVPTVAN